MFHSNFCRCDLLPCCAHDRNGGNVSPVRSQGRPPTSSRAPPASPLQFIQPCIGATEPAFTSTF
uniref:Uncharacterized protein n=1 Tax=Oryza rufipogon TaxID=4529 RepID=A0A0E0N9S4_ORYRU